MTNTKYNMKHLLVLLVAAGLFYTGSAYSQDMLKKAGKAVAGEVLNNRTDAGSGNLKEEQEPSCACNDAELIVSLGGSLKVDYRETNISTLDDGSLLLKNKITGDYYIVRNGDTRGPLKEGDPIIAGFNTNRDDLDLFTRYKEYISKNGDKYTIKFGGKTYGPFSQINKFAVTRTKDKFAALVVENVVVTEMDGKAMDEAIKNAKTDQERMQLAMKYSQQMQQKMMAGGGPSSMTAKLVSNVAGAYWDMITEGSSSPNGDAKYDDIVFIAYDKVYDLTGKQILTLKSQHIGSANIFVNSSNSAYAIYNYGTIMLSDGRSLSDLFNPHLIKTGGQVYLAYMYYSPKKNALMQCKIPF
jgi:hypothetical protein